VLAVLCVRLRSKASCTPRPICYSRPCGPMIGDCRTRGVARPALLLARAALTLIPFLVAQPGLPLFAVPATSSSGVAVSVRTAGATGLLEMASARALHGNRGRRPCMRAIGVFFCTRTGNTQEVAELVGEMIGVVPVELGDTAVLGDLNTYDGLIVGAPTWNTGAHEKRSGTSLDGHLAEIRDLQMGGKMVAVFGCGDSFEWSSNFCDAIEEIHSAFSAAGAKMIGYVDASSYQHAESKSEVDGKFLGLPLDQENQIDLTEGRVEAWIRQLKQEGMPL